MDVNRMAAADAQSFWMSAKIPNDMFLVCGFDGVPADLDAALAAVRRNVAACPELLVRIDDSRPWRYPSWVRCDVPEIVVHEPGDRTWSGCLSAVCALAASDQLDATVRAWRLHVFAGVNWIPETTRPGTVAVVQMSHALADGRRATALMGRIFGRDQPVPAVVESRLGTWALPYLAWRASAAHRRLVHDTESGAVAAPADSWPVQATNNAPAGPDTMRTVVRHRTDLPGPTVTVGVLAAISEALAAELGGVTALGAEVPMAKTGVRRAYNHYGNVGVALHPDLPFHERAARIESELAMRRQRFEHPAAAASGAATAAVPARLLRWGTEQFDPHVRSTTATGNTVVSSVNRGAADLTFGGCPLVLTTACPALSPMMGLTHGVHGIGDTVTISVHASPSALPDVDSYVERLSAVLDAGG
ncbi:WS/DGAT domain-containing protein [Mycolicibacterium mucogenicum]|uniref:WS/DGAT domain-containing protein n=1 Tax=Mycolicibacterium mucogenicum TaxID=56689 RepID=UPI000DA19B7D|nr:WS/DGAT domain-containing protein [Mycolicibacterium mucogenicum]